MRVAPAYAVTGTDAGERARSVVCVVRGAERGGLRLEEERKRGEEGRREREVMLAR